VVMAQRRKIVMGGNGFRLLIAQDFERYSNRVLTPSAFLALLSLTPGFRAVFLYRLSRLCIQHRVPFFPQLLTRLATHTCYCRINPLADIGHGLFLPHPIGVVIGAATIGSNCTIQQSVTIGGNYYRKVNGSEMPTLGDGVAVSAGAVVAGPVHIGARSIIGANVVVTRDVPSDVVVSNSVGLRFRPRSEFRSEAE
jgi:serine O-acetyltransferase